MYVILLHYLEIRMLVFGLGHFSIEDNYISLIECTTEPFKFEEFQLEFTEDEESDKLND